MKKCFLLFLSVLLCPILLAQTKWKVDPAHSSIQFEVSHLTISTVTGKFTNFNCEVTSDKGSFEGADINVNVQVNSISTENLTRDKHLREDDFFNAKKYPEMKFVSESFSKLEEGKYQAIGLLTIRDVTRKVSFPVDYSGTITMGNKTISAFKANFTINRFEYQLKWDDTLDTGSLVVGEDVSVKLSLEFVKM